jgi:hypothetical protein
MRKRTRRLIKKKRHHTKKRAYVKKTHKYKFLRGGLGDNDYQNINITDTFIFQTDCTQPGGGGDTTTKAEKIIEFKKYVFGTEEHAEIWEQILILCSEKRIPFYILTSGGKVGIIRMLQLLELDEYVTEVLCNNQNTEVNPKNVSIRSMRERFRTMPKYDVIGDILANDLLNTRAQGLFIDNDQRNRANHDFYPTIKFMYVGGEDGEQIDVYTKTYQTRFTSYVSRLSEDVTGPIFLHAPVLYEKRKTNLVKLTVLEKLYEQIAAVKPEIKVVFSDFDGTMSPWRGALPLHLTKFANPFISHFNIKKVPLVTTTQLGEVRGD